ncbi:NAD(P)H-quinone oxidoreductase subunit S, chloroplastic [Amaranthus tricolor]|uniref:NAD(P)H-quinone oxidoreductase subunit S, chloroplastic n=1 Tax=Amaranthus tricolor TaxID=29722 RepID=UPI0025829E23|nr:NAD(P)H-quinone oxidoreductase subunit S, chloroplastic [Amaranthus tricolor]
MASCSLVPPSFQGAHLQKSQFLGQNHIKLSTLRSISTSCPKTISTKPIVSAKFDLYQIMGGRGLCNGEAGLKEELKKDTQTPPKTSDGNEEEELDNNAFAASNIQEIVPEDGFEKELLGLTGGFPGGEKGLKSFIEKNPPPPKTKSKRNDDLKMVLSSKKPKPPTLPLVLPGMIAVVKNPNNPYYMYCGIVQRITDGKAGVLFEGGNWDRLITFRLEELERREKGPPMTNPKSVVLEPLIEKLESQSTS